MPDVPHRWPDGRPVLLGAATLEPGRGGIARVARLTARALADAGAVLRPISYLDGGGLRVADAAVAGAHGRKLAFAALAYRKGAGCGAYVYDSIGIARAHPRALDGGRGYAVWMHGIEAWEHLLPKRARALRAARRVIVNSHYTLARFQSLHGPLPQARVCWLATEEDEAPSLSRAPEGPPTLLVLARLDKGDAYKGHDALIAIWPQVVAVVPRARLLIVGDGDGRAALEHMARASAAAGSIVFAGFVAETDLPAIWAGASAFAMPSRKEGFGLVYVEAMRHGLPVIAAVHDAGAEVNLDGETGFNVDMDRPGELARRVIEVLTDRDLRARLGRNAQARWRAHFRYSAFRDRLLGALLEPAAP